MAAPLFLSMAQILQIHEQVIRQHGGDATVRDRGLLESAAAMPQAQFAGRQLHRTRAEMAAAYLFHLCRNHPFVDGNKRTALAAAGVFLRANGMVLSAASGELEEMVMAVAEGHLAKSGVTRFIRKHVHRKSGQVR